jgi:drug/metabolite transporter (DMT)-like permease
MPTGPKTNAVNRERIGLCLVVAAAFGFGISPSYAKLAYDGGAEPLTLVAARFTMCVLTMSIIAKMRQTSIRISRKLLYLPFIMGLLLVWNATGYLSAVKEIQVSLAAALFYTFPLQVALFSWVMGFECLSIRRIAALLLGFMGILLVISLGLSEMNIYGVTLALGAGCGVALTSLLFSRVADINNSIALMIWSMVVACLLSWLFTFLLDDFALPSTQGGWNGFIISMLGFSLSVIAYYLALPMIGAIRAALVANLEPIIAVLMAMMILHERLEVLQIAGIVLIVTAVYVGNRKPIRGPRQSGIQGS